MPLSFSRLLGVISQKIVLFLQDYIYNTDDKDKSERVLMLIRGGLYAFLITLQTTEQEAVIFVDK